MICVSSNEDKSFISKCKVIYGDCISIVNISSSEVFEDFIRVPILYLKDSGNVIVYKHRFSLDSLRKVDKLDKVNGNYYFRIVSSYIVFFYIEENLLRGMFGVDVNRKVCDLEHLFDKLLMSFNNHKVVLQNDLHNLDNECKVQDIFSSNVDW